MLLLRVEAGVEFRARDAQPGQTANAGGATDDSGGFRCDDMTGGENCFCMCCSASR